MPYGVSKSSTFRLPEIKTKLKLTKIINPPGTWRQPLGKIIRSTLQIEKVDEI